MENLWLRDQKQNTWGFSVWGMFSNILKEEEVVYVLQQLGPRGIKELFREKWGWVEGLGAASPCQKGSWVRPSVQGMSAPGQPGGAGLLSLWWGAGGGSRYWVPPELWLCALESSRYTGRQCWSCCEKKITHKFTFDRSAASWSRTGYNFEITYGRGQWMIEKELGHSCM